MFGTKLVAIRIRFSLAGFRERLSSWDWINPRQKHRMFHLLYTGINSAYRMTSSNWSLQSYSTDIHSNCNINWRGYRKILLLLASYHTFFRNTKSYHNLQFAMITLHAYIINHTTVFFGSYRSHWFAKRHCWLSFWNKIKIGCIVFSPKRRIFLKFHAVTPFWKTLILMLMWKRCISDKMRCTMVTIQNHGYWSLISFHRWNSRYQF